jgi:hypothetical protein
MVVFWKALVFRSIKTGELIYFPQTAPLIVPDQKVTTGALNAVVATVVECVGGMHPGTDGGCVPAGTPTLKSVEIQRVRVLEEERVLPWGTALSPLFIEVEGCRAVVVAHLALAVTKSWEV